MLIKPTTLFSWQWLAWFVKVWPLLKVHTPRVSEHNSGAKQFDKRMHKSNKKRPHTNVSVFLFKLHTRRQLPGFLIQVHKAWASSWSCMHSVCLFPVRTTAPPLEQLTQQLHNDWSYMAPATNRTIIGMLHTVADRFFGPQKFRLVGYFGL